MYFWERVKSHWTSTIAWMRVHIITIAIIDFNWYWVATLFSQFGQIVSCIKDVVCNVFSYLPMQFLHLAKKYATTTRKIISLLIIYHTVHIYIEGIGLFLVLRSPASPSIITSIYYTCKKIRVSPERFGINCRSIACSSIRVLKSIAEY